MVTLYSTLPMQLYMIHAIKQPTLEAVEILFNPELPLVEKIKAGKKLWKAFQAISKIPEPTLENTWHPNSHNLIHLRNWLTERCLLSAKRVGLIRRVINFVIILYDFDPPWRFIFDSLTEEAFKMKWESKGYGRTEITKYTWWRE